MHGLGAAMSGCVDEGPVSAGASATVTVLVTGLEGSTAMADRLGPAAAGQLRAPSRAAPMIDGQLSDRVRAGDAPPMSVALILIALTEPVAPA